jgi:hypothetical protein
MCKNVKKFSHSLSFFSLSHFLLSSHHHPLLGCVTSRFFLVLTAMRGPTYNQIKNIEICIKFFSSVFSLKFLSNKEYFKENKISLREKGTAKLFVSLFINYKKKPSLFSG